MGSLNWIDQPTAVRQGEELASNRLADYLKAHLADLDGPLVTEQFARGYSNLTYLLQMGERELVLRRPPFGANIKSAHDMGREYMILSHLHPVYAKAPRPLLYCDDDTVLGAPFYVMERVRGIILRPQMPPEMVPPPPLMARISQSFVQNLAELHAIDYQAAGLGELGRPQGYIERQIKGWTRRYQQARTDNIPEIERVATWLADHMPPESGAALIHNDYKYDNLVLDPADWSQITAVLDWEMATIGDPLMDLGAALGYWIEPDDPEEMQRLQFSPTTLPGNLSREELVTQYAAQSGREPAHLVFYYVYGLFKVAVIVQQIYQRYQLGFSQDPRFAQLLPVVRSCGRVAWRAVKKKRIHP